MALKTICSISALLLLASCREPVVDQSGPQLQVSGQAKAGRWYQTRQVAEGSELFAQHCAACHGDQAQGLAEDWREKLPDGSFPPPPLNGTAHAWHHPISVLDQVIAEGGVALGGKMPAFASVLDQAEREAVIAFFQNYWSEDVYSNWLQMGGTN